MNPNPTPDLLWQQQVQQRRRARRVAERQALELVLPNPRLGLVRLGPLTLTLTLTLTLLTLTQLQP